MDVKGGDKVGRMGGSMVRFAAAINKLFKEFRIHYGSPVQGRLAYAITVLI